jgi:hypothetical protein
MTVQPGYNIVTEAVADTDTELTVLDFFRRLVENAEVDTPVTVTYLDRLLLNTEPDDRAEVLVQLRRILRESSSLNSLDAVQFLIEGSIVEDVQFRVRIEQRQEGVYLDVGEMFVEEPQRLSPTHAVARK